MLLESAINEYLVSLKRTNSKHTSRNYARYLNRFLDFTGNIEVSKITLELTDKYHEFLNQWIDPENGKSLKATTKNYYLIALRSLVVYLSQTQLLSIKPEDIFLDPQDPKYWQIFSADQLETILKAPDLTTKEGLRDRLILEILANTGLRVSEIAMLDIVSINTAKLEIAFCNNGKNRIMELPKTAVPIFNGYMVVRHDAFRPLFVRFQGKADPNDNGEKMRLSSRSIERIVQRYGKAARVADLTPQMLRNSLAATLLNIGSDVADVAEILGHTNPNSTKVYARVKLGF